MRTTAGIDWEYTRLSTGGLWVALSSDTAAPSAGDTTLAGEVARAAATLAHTAGTNTFTASITYTATGTVIINKVGMFDASTAGNLITESVEPSPPTLNAADQITQVVSITY